MMDDKYIQTINKIVRLSKENTEFRIALHTALNVHGSSTPSLGIKEISDDVSAIRGALEIRANNSISYDFINNQRLRDQLIIDNLRMENAALNLKDDENSRFYSFCINAFYQIENVVNYYFHTLYPNIEELLTEIERATLNEMESYRFHRNPNKVYQSVGDIDVANKLNAICNTLFHGDNIKLTYSQLRQVRNEGEHRCMTIINDPNKKDKLYNFFKYNTFNSIRVLLINLVNSVKNAIKDRKN